MLDVSQYDVYPAPAVSLKQAQQLCRLNQPDVLLLALSLARPLPDVAVIYFRQHYPAVHLILLDDDDDDQGHNFLKLGVAGYLRRTDSFDRWQACFQAIVCGSVFLSQSYQDPSPTPPDATLKSDCFDLEVFSERERQLVRLLLQGRSNKEIAMILGLSDSTVRNNLSILYKKMDINSRSAVRPWLIQKKMIDDEFGEV